MHTDPAHIWPHVQADLRQAVPAATYDIWLAPLRVVALEDRHLTVEAPAELRAWVTERLAHVLQASAASVLGPGATVDVVGVAPGTSTTGGDPPPADQGRGSRPDPQTGEDAGLNPKYTFGQFVIGDANRFAHAAALAVAELPGQAYNPLFVYGPPGVGKTHLLHSIGNYVRLYGAGLTVRYTTVETFTNEFIAALRAGGIDRFKDRYRRNDVLLIDDVQFLAAKVRTEEEFFHTFNALYDTGSQLVLTSDRLPRDLDAVHARLRERFESGLVTDIRPPDVVTRMTVLRKRVQHDGVALGDEGVLEAIAARVKTNVRALEGALIRVVAFASLTGRALTPELATEVLDELYPTPPGAVARGGEGPSIEVIQELTAEAFGISRDELLSSGRTPRLAWPRQVAMFLAREHTDATLPAIGAHFGGRNHTTVLHACRRTAARLAEDPEAFDTVRRLTERLGQGGGGTRPDRRD